MISRKKSRTALFGLLSMGCMWGGQVNADYSAHPQALEFIERVTAKHNLDPVQVKNILAQAEKQEAILEAIARPAEKILTWGEYRKIFLGEIRISQGVQFWLENRDVLVEVSEQYGVPEEFIVAIIGVETSYGRIKGSYRVIDALTTLGFDYPPRASFFSGELEQFLLLAKEQKQNPLDLMGSYAGAMGYGQFIPSSYRAYAVDFDGDQVADIWDNPADAIASVANYFNKHGWVKGGRVVSRARIAENYDKDLLNDRGKPTMSIAKLEAKGFLPIDEDIKSDELAVSLMYEGEYGKEFWLGFNNFYVITRYNRSLLYALAVFQLSQEVKSRLIQTIENNQLNKNSQIIESIQTIENTQIIESDQSIEDSQAIEDNQPNESIPPVDTQKDTSASDSGVDKN